MKSHSDLTHALSYCPDPASFKAPDTGIYLACNPGFAALFDLNPAQLAGLNVHDLAFLRTRWGRHYAARMKKMDARALDQRAPVREHQPFLRPNGEVMYQALIKTPVLGFEGNALGLLTCIQEQRHTLSCADRYRLHRQFYDRPEAIRRTLACLGVAALFMQMPAEMSLRVFLEKADGYDNAQLARRLRISQRNVEAHLGLLGDMVVAGDLYKALCAVDFERAVSNRETPVAAPPWHRCQ